jgi:methylmalonyl-CoA mutase
LKKSDFKDTLHFDEFPPISMEKWESVIEKDLKGKNYKDILRWNSGEGVSPLPFYREEILADLKHKPAPVQRSGDWCIMEPIENSDVKAANQEALEALENGALGLSFSPDKDYLHSKSDLESLLEGIQIELITLQFQPILSKKEVAGWLKEVCEDRELNLNTVNMIFNYSPLSSALPTGNLVSLSDFEDTLNEFGKNFHTCSVDASISGNSGATIVQQLAFALAEGNEYLGLNKNLAEQLHFNFSTGSNYFLEIAKVRAFRLNWSQILREYDMGDSNAYVSAETALWNKSKTDAHNNMLRSTTEAMSAALGGADSVVIHRYDHHFSEDSNFASRIARNSQLILQEEAYLDKVADPGSGSYYIEVLTDSLAEKAWELFQDIEAKGGFYECLKSGFIQDLISTSRKEKIEAYKEKKKIQVGVNKYQPEEELQGVSFKVLGIPAANLGEHSFTEIQTVEALNIETELQRGEA